MNTPAYILVYSTGHAICIEKKLVVNSIDCKLVPVPRHLSSDCGVCVRFAVEDAIRVFELLDANNLQYEQLVIE